MYQVSFDASTKLGLDVASCYKVSVPYANVSHDILLKQKLDILASSHPYLKLTSILNSKEVDTPRK
ncbi:hypothetical protein Dsin_015594 [Dipteronia sinensis]|uniref:Uncharacterized protein n=1 Tax=Dipteronia sinensis TaxID=43782 RepID=A0AAE0AC91_9ROSI|nr:hypothetical protein Dsin_015594 [Dipteronia sinensis]